MQATFRSPKRILERYVERGSVVLRLIAAASFMTGLAGQPAMSESYAPVLPEIMLTHDDGMIRIEGVVSGTGAAEVTATLSIAHRGSGGSMTTEQTRKLTLAADDKHIPVASTAINFGPTSHLLVDLSVTYNEFVIAKSRVEIGVAP